ncbi:lysoplasmalogenase [Photobacterium lutimaris]|uniref:Lysoplasmalogenase n=1 Tax=Photobacterium lutimaris TaxID=388278 RepID=A0A2T3IWP6_9GAMM|nr:lysoplasmalogenase [Photobacterium lutimaris]PSU32915.1 lysoplasmalogenase [Photobacterium lutimaris]TDR74100.1 putative membrane protein YhhN [Photobacterium lutimaris]
MWVWLAISLSALLHITAAYHGPRWQFYLFKPVTLLLLLVVAWSAGDGGIYHLAILLGLALSMVGDVFLMWPKERFIPGLVAFALAHISYSAAFWSQLESQIVWWLPAMLAAAGVIVFLLLLPTLGNMVIPVAVYIVVITQMAWAAGEFWLTSSSTPAVLAFAGAAIFMFSDLCLAIDRFRGPFRSATTLIMTSYFLAQSLFVATLLAL